VTSLWNASGDLIAGVFPDVQFGAGGVLFTVLVDSLAVPEPTTLALFGAAMLFGVGLRRRSSVTSKTKRPGR
jgi:PEP-CTERM motif-containing protein